MKCLICDNEIQPMNSTDIGVGIIEYCGLAICQECMESPDPEVKAEVEKIIDASGEMPF